MKTDYVLRETTRAYWPGMPPYRSEATPRGHGYPSYKAAADRARYLQAAFGEPGKYGVPEFSVIERDASGQELNVNCRGCLYCLYCYDCVRCERCRNCVGCTGLTGARYVWRGEQLKCKEYFIRLAQLAEKS